MPLTTTNALKEWAVAVDALEQGKTIMLLRKGGIREENNRFHVTYNPVLLYPTYEHQQPHLLKPDYASQVTPVASGWHPQTVRIGSWATITDIFQLSTQAAVDALLPYHIWNEQFASGRFKWKPRQPLYVLLLRIYKLPSVQRLPYRSEYGGCRSWINVAEPISLDGAVPVVNDADYSQQTAQIRQILESILMESSS